MTRLDLASPLSNNSILEMNELDREGILGDRQELLTERASKRELKRMVKAKRGAEGGGVGLSSASGIIGDDGGTRTGRERKATGTTTEKRETLEKLKRKREAKGKRAEQLVRPTLLYSVGYIELMAMDWDRTGKMMMNLVKEKDPTTLIRRMVLQKKEKLTTQQKLNLHTNPTTKNRP